MKKSIILLVIGIVAICCPMQAQHLKFMGIPLTGTISQFQSKLTAKGVKYNKETSKFLQAGIRAFKGTFAGESSDIYVHYDPSTKIVYRAKAVTSCLTESLCESKYEEMKELLSTKYPDAYETSDVREGHEVYHYVFFKLENGDAKPIGTIDLYVTTPNYLDLSYNLHIDYTDYENGLKADNSKMDDL